MTTQLSSPPNSGSSTTGTGGPAGAGAGTVPPARQVLRTRWLAWRWGLVVAIVVGLAALIAAFIVPRGTSDRLGPTNAAPDGSRALVQVLGRQGVDVVLRTDSRAVVTSTDARSTLLVTDTELLGPDQLERLETDDVANLVLVEPDQPTLDRLAPGLKADDLVGPHVRAAGCAVPAAERAGSARAGGLIYSIGAGSSAGLVGATVCYPETGNPAEGSYVVEQRTDRKITVIGQSDLLTNQYLGRDGDAALALATLGEQPQLVWYTPNPLEPTSGQRPGLAGLLPGWVLWVIVQLTVVVLVVMLWRSRRLGRLVPEPLPVVVRAAETQEGRARLYRQASARGRAGDTLRGTALRRLASRLAAPSGTTPEQLVTLVAAATGRDPVAVGALLLGPAPNSDSALIELADDLDAVQQDVSTSLA